MTSTHTQLELLAQAKLQAWKDYCDTGEDKPSWADWLLQMEEIVGKRMFRLNIIQHSIMVAYGRAS